MFALRAVAAHESEKLRCLIKVLKGFDETVSLWLNSYCQGVPEQGTYCKAPGVEDCGFTGQLPAVSKCEEVKQVVVEKEQTGS